MNNKKDENFEMFPIKEMNDLLNYLFDNPFTSIFEQQPFQVDVYNMKEMIVIEAELPGYNKDQIQIDIVDQGIKITAEDNQEFETVDEKHNFYKKEQSSKKMERIVHIPYHISNSAIEAQYNNRTLQVIIPK